jgi:tetratricopeptide (TPR) repeat protein
MAAYRIGDFELAIADYTRVIDLKPDALEAYESRSRAYAMLGLDAEAGQDVAALAEMGLDVSDLEDELADLGLRR